MIEEKELIEVYKKTVKLISDRYLTKGNVVETWVIDRVRELLNEGKQVEEFMVTEGIERGRTVYNVTDKPIVKEDYETIKDLFFERGHHYINNTDWYQFNELVNDLIHDELFHLFGDNYDWLLDSDTGLTHEITHNIEAEYLETNLEEFIEENNIIIQREDIDSNNHHVNLNLSLKVKSSHEADELQSLLNEHSSLINIDITTADNKTLKTSIIDVLEAEVEDWEAI